MMRKLSCCHFLFLLLIGTALWWLPPGSHAQNVSCTATMTAPGTMNVDLVQGTGLSATGTLNYTCTNTSTTAEKINACFNIGDGANGLTHWTPRVMTDGTGTAGDQLQFQLYQGTTTTIWGSNGNTNVPNPYEITGTVPKKNNGALTGSEVITANIWTTPPQTAVPPNAYQDNFSAAGDHTSITHSESTTTAPTTCNTYTDGTFPFVVSANVVKSCTVNASNMIFPNEPSTAVNTPGQSSVTVTCSYNSAYNVGLLPSTANGGTANGTGSMATADALPGNTDKVPYTLYQNSNHTTVWGNTIGTNTLTTTNGLAAGNGTAQSYTVYGLVPNANFTPDTYVDTVTVTVTY